MRLIEGHMHSSSTEEILSQASKGLISKTKRYWVFASKNVETLVVVSILLIRFLFDTFFVGYRFGKACEVFL